MVSRMNSLFCSSFSSKKLKQKQNKKKNQHKLEKKLDWEIFKWFIHIYLTLCAWRESEKVRELWQKLCQKHKILPYVSIMSSAPIYQMRERGYELQFMAVLCRKMWTLWPRRWLCKIQRVWYRIRCMMRSASKEKQEEVMDMRHKVTKT